MKNIDWTAKTPAENLAFDEALLNYCENHDSLEVLRFWEPKDYFVVLGYSNKILKEVRSDYCETNNIPVLRRASGGGTILQGPGCLNYTLVLRIDSDDAFKSITKTNQTIMQKQRNALMPLIPEGLSVRGDTDLTCGMLKFSGNAQRRKKNCLLFHGTFLLNFDIDMIKQTLQLPERQPEYRNQRTHEAFLMNLMTDAKSVRQSLIKEWQAEQTLEIDLSRETDELIKVQYGNPDWIKKF